MHSTRACCAGQVRVPLRLPQLPQERRQLRHAARARQAAMHQFVTHMHRPHAARASPAAAEPAVKCLGDCSNNAHDCQQNDCKRHAQGVQSKYKCTKCTPISTVPDCVPQTGMPALLKYLYLGSCKEQSQNSVSCHPCTAACRVLYM